MTEVDLGTEYRAVGLALGLDFDSLAAIALDGIEASWLDDDDKRALRAAFETALRVLRDGAAPPSPPA